MANVIIGNTLATPIAIPTKVSELENDAEYITGGVASQMDHEVYQLVVSDINTVTEELEWKVDRPDIRENITNGGVSAIRLLWGYNVEYRHGQRDGISISLEDGEYERDYICGLSFDSGATPTEINYTDTGILNWVGTDCTTSDGLSIFQPSPNTHYDIVFYFNGRHFIGLVNGFVPASGNEAV